MRNRSGGRRPVPSTDRDPLVEEVIMAGPRRSRVEGTSGGSPWGRPWRSVATPGCSPKAGAERTPPPPVVSVVEARRMTVPIMAEPIGTTRALQEVSDPCPRARVPQGDPLPGGRRRQGGPAPVRHRRGALQGQARRGPGDAGAGRGRPEEGAGLQGAGGRRGPARGRPGDARAGRGRGAARAVAATSGTPPRSRTSSASRRCARRTRRRSRPTRPAWTRPRPTTRRTSSPPRPTSPGRRPRSPTPRST